MILPASYSNGFAPRDGQPLYPSLWRGCVGAWNPGLGPTGSTLRDWSGRGNNGTLTNGPTWITSQGKYALMLDGTDDRVAAPALATSSNMTLSIWHYLTSTSDEMLLNATPTNSMWNLFYIGSALTLRGGTVSPQLAYTPSGILSRWTHVAATLSGTTGTLFIDGSQVASGSIAAVGASPTGTDIGAYSDFGSGYFATGNLDDARIYTRTLNANEIRLLSSRRGIAYELAPRRRSSSAVQFNRRRRLLLGST